MLALLATSMLINELLGGNVTAMMNDENCWQNKDSFWLLTLIKDLLQSAENPQGLTYFYIKSETHRELLTVLAMAN